MGSKTARTGGLRLAGLTACIAFAISVVALTGPEMVLGEAIAADRRLTLIPVDEETRRGAAPDATPTPAPRASGGDRDPEAEADAALDAHAGLPLADPTGPPPPDRTAPGSSCRLTSARARPARGHRPLHRDRRRRDHLVPPAERLALPRRHDDRALLGAGPRRERRPRQLRGARHRAALGDAASGRPRTPPLEPWVPASPRFPAGPRRPCSASPRLQSIARSSRRCPRNPSRRRHRPAHDHRGHDGAEGTRVRSGPRRRSIPTAGRAHAARRRRSRPARAPRCCAPRPTTPAAARRRPHRLDPDRRPRLIAPGGYRPARVRAHRPRAPAELSDGRRHRHPPRAHGGRPGAGRRAARPLRRGARRRRLDDPRGAGGRRAARLGVHRGHGGRRPATSPCWRGPARPSAAPRWRAPRRRSASSACTSRGSRPPARSTEATCSQVGDTVYVGRGGRTNGEGIRQFRAHLPHRTVVPVPLGAVLHLKSAVTALPDGTIVCADLSAARHLAAAAGARRPRGGRRACRAARRGPCADGRRRRRARRSSSTTGASTWSSSTSASSSAWRAA